MVEIGNSMFGSILFQSFKNWGAREKDKRLRAMYGRLEDRTFDVIKAGLSELDNAKPGTFDWWWVKNHMRFSIKGEQQRLVHSLIYQFLTKYARGTLQDEIDSTKYKPKRPRRQAEVVGEG